MYRNTKGSENLAKAVRKLVNHDSEVLQALVETTRMANELANNE